MIKQIEADVATFKELNEWDKFIVVTSLGPPSKDFGNGHTLYILEKVSCRGEEEAKNFGYTHFAIRERDGACLNISPDTQVIRVVGYSNR